MWLEECCDAISELVWRRRASARNEQEDVTTSVCAGSEHRPRLQVEFEEIEVFDIIPSLFESYTAMVDFERHYKQERAWRPRE